MEEEGSDVWKGHLLFYEEVEGGGTDLGERMGDDTWIFLQVSGFPDCPLGIQTTSVARDSSLHSLWFLAAANIWCLPQRRKSTGSGVHRPGWPLLLAAKGVSPEPGTALGTSWRSIHHSIHSC